MKKNGAIILIAMMFVFLPAMLFAGSLPYIALLARDSISLDVDEDNIQQFLISNSYQYDIVDSNMIKTSSVDLSKYSILYMRTGSAPVLYYDSTVISKINTWVENGGKLILEYYGLYLGEYLGIGSMAINIWNPVVYDEMYFVEPVSSTPLLNNINSWSPPLAPDKNEQLISKLTVTGILYYVPHLIFNDPSTTIQYWLLLTTYGWYNQETGSDYCIQNSGLCTSDRSVYLCNSSGTYTNQNLGIKYKNLGNGTVYALGLSIGSTAPASNIIIGPVANQMRKNVIGAGSPPSPLPHLEASPQSYDFGQLRVGTCSATPQEFILSNTGNGNLNISEIAISNNANFTLALDGGTNPCYIANPTITPGDSRTFTAKFCPSVKGNSFANVTITSNDPDSPQIQIPIKGSTKDSTYTGDVSVAFVKVAVDLEAPSSWEIMSGHAWIEIIDLSSEEEKRETWGTWKNPDFYDQNGFLHPNRELYRSPAASRSLFVTKKQYDKLRRVIDKYKSKGDLAWGFLNNCTAFAKDAWQSVSGEKIDTYCIEDYGFPRPVWPNPISVMYSIIDLNGGVSDRTINQCNSPYCDSICPPFAAFCK
jgi:hypothetical protein